MIDPPSLRTERLFLRPPLESDLDAWAALAADEEAARYVGGVRSRPEAWRSLAVMAGSWALKGFGMFSVVERATGDCIGRIGPWYPEGWPGREVGWALMRSAQGRGFGFEAASAAIAWTFETLGWDDVIHVIDHNNLPSMRLAERLGSVRRGPVALPDPYSNSVVDA